MSNEREQQNLGVLQSKHAIFCEQAKKQSRKPHKNASI